MIFNIFKKFTACTLILCLALALASCEDNQTQDPELLIGDTGIETALQIVRDIPFRKAYSQQEKDTAGLIENALRDMGYNPVISEFFSEEDETMISRNIYVRIPGEGFLLGEDNDDQITVFRQVIIGARYDTVFGIEDSMDVPGFDGIQDNASGVGALLSVAEAISDKTFGYDIVLVFFGAGHDDFAGARHFAANMSEQEISDTDVMYNIESIYAGDKLYANAGNNSVEPGMKYSRRRKLYELSDVAITHRIDLRFNQSDLDVDVTGDGEPNVYREITITRSDHTVFDEMNIPCVYIESFEYFGASLEDHVESRNPFFAATGGMIRGTENDSSERLADILEEGRLVTRIKNTAFLIVKAVERGIFIE